MSQKELWMLIKRLPGWAKDPLNKSAPIGDTNYF